MQGPKKLYRKTIIEQAKDKRITQKEGAFKIRKRGGKPRIHFAKDEYDLMRSAMFHIHPT